MTFPTLARLFAQLEQIPAGQRTEDEQALHQELQRLELAESRPDRSREGLALPGGRPRGGVTRMVVRPGSGAKPIGIYPREGCGAANCPKQR